MSFGPFPAFCGPGRTAAPRKGGWLGCCWHQTAMALSPHECKPLGCFPFGWAHENKVRLLLSRIETELCSCAGSQGMDVLLPKKHCVLLHGAEDSEARGLTPWPSPATVGIYSDLHQATGPPFGAAFRIKAQLRQVYCMDICDFYFTSN